MPVIVVMAAISIALLHGSLAVRNRLPRIAIILFIAGASFVLPLGIGLFPGDREFYGLVVCTALGHALWLSAALLLCRYRGFRLVRMKSASQQVYATET